MRGPVHTDSGAEQLSTSRPGGSERAEADLDGLRQAAERSPNDAEAHYLLGRALADRDQLREAVPALQQAIRLKADHVPALVLLGRTLIRLGNPTAGKAALTAALQRTPRNYASQFSLGNMLRAAGCDVEALAAYETAIRFGHETASVHHNRGICLRALERFEEAADAYQRAVKLDPNHVKAHNNLGNCLRRLQKYAAAERALRRAVELKPDWFAPHYGLGRVLHNRQRPGEAVVAFRRALRLKPDHAEAHVRLGVVLQEIGQLDAAKTSYRRALELAPDYPAALGLLAQLDREPLDRPTLERLEARLASGKYSAIDRQHLHFALAQRYDQIQELGPAFDHLVEGNRLKRAETRYDPEAESRRFRKIMRTFDRDFFARHGTPGNPSPLPIFVVGMPRSGTTLLEQILASHSHVHGAGEIGTLGNVARSTLKAAISKNGDRAARALAPEALQEVARDYLTQVRALAPHATRVVDKMLTNFAYVGLIKLMLPNAHVIHARRHPLDTCLSIFRKLFAAGLTFSYDLGELGAYYVLYARLMRHWHEVLPGFVLDVQYEALIEDQRGMTERILAHCGLDWEDSCLQFHETQRAVRTASLSQVRQPIYRSSAGVWKRYGERLRPLIDALGDELDPAELAEWSAGKS
jgi:tetratricopeptide (TPR) repeat protein